MTRLVRVTEVGAAESATVVDAQGAIIGRPVVEVVVDGWRFDLIVEDEEQARLRERATSERSSGSSDGRVEIRAIIPGRIVDVSAVDGDKVTAGQSILVVEAMKMQNELRAPRAGTIEYVAVGVGSTVELGDLLVVIR